MKIFLIAFHVQTFVAAVPFQINILQGRRECMWDLLKESESATLSVIILEGTSLKASLVVEGPFANPEVQTTFDLLQAEHKFTVDKHRWTNHLTFKHVADFEHYQMPPPEFEDDEDIHVYGNDDDEVPESKEEDMAAIQRHIEERRARQLANRRLIHEARQKRADRMAEFARMNADKIREEGSPYELTISAKADGWYRGCVEAEFNRVLVELEFRTTKEYDGIDPETTHVYTYEKWKERQEEKLLDEGKPENEPSIKVEDFLHTRGQVRDLHRLLNQISNAQRTARNRVKIHAELGEHIHDKMTRFSVFMTILFMAAAAYQTFSIHRWFSKGGSSVLGR